MKIRYIWNKLKNALTLYSQVIKDFVEKSDHSKSTILKPLAYVMGVLGSLFLLSFSVGAPIVLTYIIFTALMIVFVLYLWIYVYYAFKNPDLLRSEKYVITKMAIEKSVVGDNLAGIIMPGEPDKSVPKLDQGV